MYSVMCCDNICRICKYGDKRIMMQYGKSPFLECSTRGDKRFSAFCAIVNGKSIEEQYQAAKIFEDGSTGLHWKKAKGRKAINAEECVILYERLWRQYILEHPELLQVLKQASGLCDTFATRGNINQAEILWKIRNDAIGSNTPDKHTHQVKHTRQVNLDTLLGDMRIEKI